MNDPYHIDAERVRRSFGRSARSYDAAAVLQQRVRTELLERLELVRLEPAVVLDLGAGTGHGSPSTIQSSPSSGTSAASAACASAPVSAATPNTP